MIARSKGRDAAPGPARKIAATLAVVAIVLAVWWFIEYRQRPPPPPHKIGEQVQIP